jgi:hypothetical protein
MIDHLLSIAGKQEENKEFTSFIVENYHNTDSSLFRRLLDNPFFDARTTG